MKYILEDVSNPEPEPDPDYEEYMTEQTISEEIPQINLSDPKQLADFARYLEFSNHLLFI